MIVSSLDEQIVENFAETANFLLGIWMCLVGLEDQHAYPVLML